VPARPARQEGDAGRVSKKALVARGGGDKDKEMPQAVSPPPRTSGERISRLEEEVHGMREVLQGQREVLDSTTRDFFRFTTWTVTSLPRMMDGTGVTYTRYFESPIEKGKMMSRQELLYCGNEATKKTKKNQLKQQYGNFKAEGSKTLKQTFNRLQAIVSRLEFMDVPIEQNDLNQKFLTSLAPEWLVYIIVWRNIDDLDTMSLDDVYNHFKVYEPKVQKRTGSNLQNMAFISSSNTSSGKSKVPNVQRVSTTSA
nr:hypothetical protein [Tanacetum cinerariifolium]